RGAARAGKSVTDPGSRVGVSHARRRHGAGGRTGLRGACRAAAAATGERSGTGRGSGASATAVHRGSPPASDATGQRRARVVPAGVGRSACGAGGGSPCRWHRYREPIRRGGLVREEVPASPAGEPPGSVQVWGPGALFTRPELKVERVSYPVMTPPAAIGVLGARSCTPELTWRPVSAHVIP